MMSYHFFVTPSEFIWLHLVVGVGRMQQPHAHDSYTTDLHDDAMPLHLMRAVSHEVLTTGF